MPQELNPAMLILARESRGMTQKEVSEKTGISSSSLNRMERGWAVLTQDVAERVAELTNYPTSFFCQEGNTEPDAIRYRRREVVAAKIMTPITARINVMYRHLEYLQGELKNELPRLPEIALSESVAPQDAAQKLRRLWKIGEPVISNLTAVMEEQGIVIASFDFKTARVDSRSLVTTSKLPVVFYNRSLLGDRQRFTLAYELGHLVMHTSAGINATRDIGHEANLFAAALLMPDKEIRKDFKGPITVAKLAELKKKWKVSMIALLYRADDLGFITPNQKNYLIKQFNNLNIRRREPIELDVAHEQPHLVRHWIAELKAKKKLSAPRIAELLHLNLDEFIELYS